MNSTECNGSNGWNFSFITCINKYVTYKNEECSGHSKWESQKFVQRGCGPNNRTAITDCDEKYPYCFASGYGCKYNEWFMGLVEPRWDKIKRSRKLWRIWDITFNI